MLEKVRPTGLPVKLVLADKGYDSESNHEYAQEVLGARAVIPVRCQRPGSKMRGWYRKRRARDFDEGAYHQRAKVETVFSVEKRKMGSVVLARVSSQQHKELVFRAISYNSWRLEALFLLFTEGFYRAARQKLPYSDLPMRGRLVPMHLSEKITFAMFVWVTLALILSFDSGLEVFLTLILMGTLVIREVTDSFTPVKTKERIDFFIYTFLVVFAIIVVRRVWEILA